MPGRAARRRRGRRAGGRRRACAAQWRVDPAQLGQPFAGRAALLSPFDRLLHDRKRMAELFEFDYHLEMYKPAAKRRWGYYALPILYGDRLVGKLDARADREAGVLRVDAIHQDVPFSTGHDRRRWTARSRTWPAGSSWSSRCPADPGQLVPGVAAMFTSQLTPNLSVSMPKLSPHGACSSGTPIVAPSASRSQ